MPVLRSREISSSATKSVKPKNATIEPLTPAKIELASGRRRSSRLAPAETTATVDCIRKRKSSIADELLSEEKALLLIDAETVEKKDGKDKGILSLRSGKRIRKTIIGDNNIAHFGVSEGMNIKIEKEELSDNIALSDISDLPENIGFQELDKSPTKSETGTVGKNKRKFNREQKVKVEVLKVEEAVELDQGQKGKDSGTGVKTRSQLKELKGKEKVIGDELPSDNIDFHNNTSSLLDNSGKKELGKEPTSSDNHDIKGRRGLSRKDKGKDKVVEDGSFLNIANLSDFTLGQTDQNSHEKPFSSEIENDTVANNSEPALDDIRIDETNAKGGGYKERFREIARKNASRFAHFSSQEPEENHVNNEPLIEESRMEADREVEDWPGPFSTAMKIIRDRESNIPLAQPNSASNKCKIGTIKWVPKKDKSPNCSTRHTPKLQDLCLEILAKNAEAISSLESVPDVIRHKLSHTLCDSRKINAQFLDLLVCGSPTEIRIRDCSWLTEEEFTKAFQKCETSALAVLQLDQCGRCLPDYLLSDTLARSPNALPLLTALSVKGACRLSDSGLNALISSAPNLRSINLSQCSLLTSDGITILADYLGSVLRELYLDDCQNIDPMLILPALLKLEQLEILSLAGIQTVSDNFICELLAVRGRKLKELILTDCTKLTDSSIKAIAETCTSLYALDLSNLCKLTDSTLGYLTNGCRVIGRLKLSRTAFSDEAVAAYLEASGESLKELSLNNIRKVGDDTAISLARRSRKLLTLDLSWCRNLTNEALGLIADSCLSLKVLKLFGCTQITNVFTDGHSNPDLQIIGLKMTPILEHLKISAPQLGPLHYSAGFY